MEKTKINKIGRVGTYEPNGAFCSIETKGCSPEVVKIIDQTLKKVAEDLMKIVEVDKEEQKKKETKKRWKPNDNDKYFYPSAFGEICYMSWKDGNCFDEGHYNFHNVFKTREEAEFELERRKIMVELQNYADDHNGEITNPSDAFWIAFDEDDMSITVEMESYLPPVGAVLFSDADTAYDAIEAIGEDRILKYMFRVNPNKELHCNGDCECCDEYDPWDEEDED